MPDFEAYLQERLHSFIPSKTREAMEYSILAQGKRVRPRLLFAVLEGYGLPIETGYPMGAAIEMIHTYSLIHDDLPAMDNDDLRRGKPTNHKVFGEDIAILAGDGLLTEAFGTALLSSCSDHQKVQLIQALVHYAGIDGMIYGQTLDLEAEHQKAIDPEQIIQIDRYKTGMLIILPLVAGAILANHQEDIPLWIQLGEAIGIQFQIQDDILDHTSSEETMGKSLSDQANEKSTFVSLLSLEGAIDLEKAYGKKILSLFEQLPFAFSGLHTQIQQLQNRKK